MDGWVEEWVDIRGVYMFSSLVKQNKKAKNCAVFCFAGKRFCFIYEVITWEKFLKRSSIHYSCGFVPLIKVKGRKRGSL